MRYDMFMSKANENFIFYEKDAANEVIYYLKRYLPFIL